MASAKASAAPVATNTAPNDISIQDFKGQEGLFLTQAQGAGLVAAGLATVDTTNVQGDAAWVTLTEAGVAALNSDSASQANAAAAITAKPVFTVRSDVPLPTVKRRGRSGSKYPIETMEVGQSFHIPQTAEDPDPAGRIASSIANARLKFAVPVTNEDGSPKMVSKTVKVYQKGPDGKFAKDAEGKRIVASTSQETVQETVNGREWAVASVDASDPEGVGARIWRTK